MRRKEELLTAERLRELVRYDPETGVMTRRICRRGSPVGAIVGSVNAQGRRVVQIGMATYHFSRLAFLYMTGHWSTELIDHINSDPLDNRWCNLRDANSRQNAHNHRRGLTNTSGFKNVWWSKTRQRWMVLIKRDGKVCFCKYFRDKDDAIRVSIIARREVHGEFARG